MEHLHDTAFFFFPAFAVLGFLAEDCFFFPPARLDSALRTSFLVVVQAFGNLGMIAIFDERVDVVFFVFVLVLCISLFMTRLEVS